MTETPENTFTAYLGPEFQQRLMWQLLVEPEFAEKTIPNLAIEYFDDPNLKRLFIIILEYFKENEKVPNLQNQSINQAINKYKTPNNIIEEESLFSVIKNIILWNERVLNKQLLHDGDIVQKSTNEFIKQQEWRKFAEFIIEKVKNGEIKKKNILGEIDEKLVKISHIGDEEDYGTEVIEGIDSALRKEFRQTISTGVDVIDTVTGGGLGRGEIGLILSPSGAGKTTLLTKIANTAYEHEKNVLQIIFEDTEDQIKRKHYTIWAKSALSRMDEETENKRVNKIIHEKAEILKGKGRLIIKRFSQENTTMLDIRNWIIRYQKKWGFKFNIVILDYLDCLESHKKTPDRNEAELVIIKSFEALASDFNIPAWTAIQSNRSGFGAEFVEAYQTGGSIKRLQKAHFFMSIAKTPAQQEANFANIRIIKARFAQDGQTFIDCTFNNDTMDIIIHDDRYPVRTKDIIKYDVDKIEDNADKLKDKSSDMEIHEAINKNIEKNVIDKINDETVNESVKNTNNDNILKNETIKRINEYSPTEINELLKKNAEILVDKYPEITNNHIEDIKTEIDKDIVNKLITDDKLIEIDGAIEGVNDGVIEGVKNNKLYYIDYDYSLIQKDSNDDILDWSGETFTKDINEVPDVKIDDIQPQKPIIIEGTVTKYNEITQNNRMYLPPKIEKNRMIVNKIGELSHDSVSKNQNNFINSDIPILDVIKEKLPEKNKNIIKTDDIEKKFTIDPDAPSDEYQGVFAILRKREKEQNVIKKD
jgi:replicative DNA helicase